MDALLRRNDDDDDSNAEEEEQQRIFFSSSSSFTLLQKTTPQTEREEAFGGCSTSDDFEMLFFIQNFVGKKKWVFLEREKKSGERRYTKVVYYIVDCTHTQSIVYYSIY